MCWLNRVIIAFILALTMLFVSFNTIANPIRVVIKLKKITAQELSEENGDEIYFAVTHYPSNGLPGHDRVPNFPEYWLSKNLPALKDITLWEQEILPDESIQVILSLIEHDAPPFNIDDHLGSVKVTLHNIAGSLESQWMKADFKDQPEVNRINTTLPEYVFKTHNSLYTVAFAIKKLPSEPS